MTLMVERPITETLIPAPPLPPDIIHSPEAAAERALTLSEQLTDTFFPHFVCIADGDEIEEHFARTAFIATLDENDTFIRVSNERIHTQALPLFELGQKDLWSGCGSINMKSLFVGQKMVDVMQDPLLPPVSKLEIKNSRIKNIFGRYAVRGFMLYDPRVGRQELQTMLTT